MVQIQAIIQILVNIFIKLLAEVPVKQSFELVQIFSTNCFIRQSIPGMHHTDREEPPANLQSAPREKNFI